MKKQRLFLLTLIYAIGLMKTIPAHAQTILGDGDLVIIGYNSDDPDQFAFMLLTDVASGTAINFTDNGWLSAGGFRANEGVIQWEADQDYSGGWVVVIDTTADTASTGTLSNISGSFSLSTSGDQIIAYQGSSTFIYAIQMNGTWDSDAVDSNSSALPAGLTNYIEVSPEVDNAVYDMSVVGGSVAAILTAVNDQSNWTSSNDRIVLPVGDTNLSNPTAVSLQSFTTNTNLVLPILATMVMVFLTVLTIIIKNRIVNSFQKV